MQWGAESPLFGCTAADKLLSDCLDLECPSAGGAGRAALFSEGAPGAPGWCGRTAQLERGGGVVRSRPWKVAEKAGGHCRQSCRSGSPSHWYTLPPRGSLLRDFDYVSSVSSLWSSPRLQRDRSRLAPQTSWHCGRIGVVCSWLHGTGKFFLVVPYRCARVRTSCAGRCNRRWSWGGSFQWQDVLQCYGPGKREGCRRAGGSCATDLLPGRSGAQTLTDRGPEEGAFTGDGADA